MRKILAILIMLSVIFGSIVLPVSAADNSKINVLINNNYVVFNESMGFPFVDGNGRTQVPLRATMEAFGATVGYDSQKGMAYVQKGDNRIVYIPINQNYIIVNGEKVKNDTSAVILNGRTYCPIRKVVEAFGCRVTWDNKSKSVIVSSIIPVILLHGRSDNSESCWGAKNKISETGENKNKFNVDASDSNFKSSDYMDISNQQINDIIDTGENLALSLKNLKASGYTTNVDLFVFNYPNVDFVQKNALLLQGYIQNLKSKYGYEKFDLIGHSKGGLVSRFYIENLYGDVNIRKLITIDTPHWGTYSAYFSYLNPLDGNMTKKLPCDVDLQNDSKMFGGKYNDMLLTIDDREKYINYKGIAVNGSEIRNQTSTLNYNRNNIKTKYYFIASVNYWNENIKLKKITSQLWICKVGM
jgi:hypothetical protein